MYLSLAALALSACGEDKGADPTGTTSGVSDSSTGASGASGTSDTPTGASGASDTPTGASDTSGSTTGNSSCSPTCEVAALECLGLVDNAGEASVGLRMAELDILAPTALASGNVADIVSNSVAPSLIACNVSGGGTFNWLLQFDTAMSTLKLGGARPVADPTKGYSFVDETIGPFMVQPITYAGVKPDAVGGFSVATGADLNMPMYLDPDATQVIVFPLSQARITKGVLSAGQNCIGDYNDEGLDPANSCTADETTRAFTTGASVTGFISLEAADLVDITILGQSLCVLLSADPATYGDGQAPVQRCKRTDGVIDFKGDWCSNTNAATDGSCADALNFTADFAASSVLIL